MKNKFFGSFFKKMFHRCNKLSYDTFCALIRVVGLSLEKKNTNMRECIFVEARVHWFLQDCVVESHCKCVERCMTL
jgi:hypothetical protein